MNYSFQLYSARNFTPWDKVLSSVAAIGYNQVEGYGDLYTEPAKIRDLLDANNLSMPSGHITFDVLENDFSAIMKTVDTLGCNKIYCPFLDEAQRPTDAKGWQQFGQRLSDIGKRVQDTGKHFGWHNHDFELKTCQDGSVPMRSILESAEDIEWQADIAWIVRAGVDPSLWISEFGPRISAVHVKDIAATGECLDEDGWADVGFGTMDWKSLLNQLREQTNAKLYVAEHDNPNDNQRFAERSLQSIKSYQ